MQIFGNKKIKREMGKKERMQSLFEKENGWKKNLEK